MGQEITVAARRGASPSVMIFECNRSITGMAIERYTSIDDAHGSRPPDVLARRLFDLGATRETTSTTLNLLARRGLIRLGRRQLVLASLDGVRTAARDRSAKAAGKA